MSRPLSVVFMSTFLFTLSFVYSLHPKFYFQMQTTKLSNFIPFPHFISNPNLVFLAFISVHLSLQICLYYRYFGHSK